jgi:hypothetical protein
MSRIARRLLRAHATTGTGTPPDGYPAVMATGIVSIAAALFRDPDVALRSFSFVAACAVLAARWHSDSALLGVDEQLVSSSATGEDQVTLNPSVQRDNEPIDAKGI